MTEPVRILVVDSDLETRDSAAALLEGGGYNVGQARDRDEALDRAHTLLPNLILLARTLSDIDSGKLCRVLKTDAAHRDALVVFTSPAPSAEEELKELEAGVDGHLTHSLAHPGLLLRVRPYVRLIELSAALRRQEEAIEDASARDAQAQLASLNLMEDAIAARSRAEQAQRELARTAELLERTGALAKVGGWALDLETVRLSWTRETFRIAEIEPPQEPALEGGINLFAPEARPTITEAIERARDHGEPYDLVLPLITAKGHHRWVRTQGFAERQGGKAVRLFGTFQDITEQRLIDTRLRESETLLKGVVDSAMDAIITVDERFLVVTYNAAAAHMFGTPAEQAVGLPVENLMPARFRAEHAGNVEGFARDGRATRTMGRLGHVYGQHANGEEFLAEASISHLSLAGKKIFTVIMRDITAREQAKCALLRSLREKEALLKEVHHRVKNNLQIITSLLRLEIGRNAGLATRSVLRDMQARIQSMAVLHELLYGSGTFAEVELDNYMRTLAVQCLRALTNSPGSIQIKFDLDSIKVGMDVATSCGLLINELISNSVKHAFPDGRSGEVHLSLKLVENGTGLELSVSDDGVGLPSDWEVRLRGALGLQLVSDLATQLGGTLRVGPAPHSIFSVAFPVSDLHASKRIELRESTPA